jgi:hypothetical protein
MVKSLFWNHNRRSCLADPSHRGCQRAADFHLRRLSDGMAWLSHGLVCTDIQLRIGLYRIIASCYPTISWQTWPFYAVYRSFLDYTISHTQSLDWNCWHGQTWNDSAWHTQHHNATSKWLDPKSPNTPVIFGFNPILTMTKRPYNIRGCPILSQVCLHFITRSIMVYAIFNLAFNPTCRGASPTILRRCKRIP